jgi:hypothetical protein
MEALEGGRRDSNPRQPGPQPGALPAELRPPCKMQCSPGATFLPDAPVAQWTERRTSNPRVAGSNPAGRTSLTKRKRRSLAGSRRRRSSLVDPPWSAEIRLRATVNCRATVAQTVAERPATRITHLRFPLEGSYDLRNTEPWEGHLVGFDCRLAEQSLVARPVVGSRLFGRPAHRPRRGLCAMSVIIHHA